MKLAKLIFLQSTKNNSESVVKWPSHDSLTNEKKTFMRTPSEAKSNLNKNDGKTPSPSLIDEEEECIRTPIFVLKEDYPETKIGKTYLPFKF